MKEFDLDWLSNPKVFEVNRLSAHSDHVFRTPDESYEQLRINQNGKWKFKFSENLKHIDMSFFEDGYDDSDWGYIQVPGHFQLQGYDAPQYVNIMYPWDGLESLEQPQIPTKRNPVGQYVKYFDLPENFEKDAVKICFDGVESAYYLWLNGHFVGYCEDSFTPSEFDLSPFIKEKNNRLCCMVVQFSSGSWLEDQDFWRFGGIFRDVNLFITPKIHIQDLHLVQVVAEDLKSATLTCKLALEKRGEGNSYGTLSLYDAAHSLVCETKLEQLSEKSNLVCQLNDVNLWSDEVPYLYKAKIKIFDENSELIEIVDQKVGFRRFEIKDSVMMLNGKRIIFKGVNRHEFNARTGRCVTREDAEWDIKCFKRNNINAVRTSHYPNRKDLYELCDKYGIYIVDEVNLETHGTWVYRGTEDENKNRLPDGKPEWRRAVLDRGNTLFQRDKNHPSILFWSLGNESSGGKTLYELSEFFRQNDKSRLVHYEGVFQDRRYPDTSDVESQMYSKPDDIARYLDENPNKPLILCEYAHTMGNSGGNLAKYMDLISQYPQYQGGFIWDYLDQALWTKDPYGNEYLATGGDFGDRPNDFYFCGNGLVFADRKETPKMQEVRHVYRNVNIICDKDGVTIQNKYLWTNTEKFEFRWELLRNGEKYSNGTFNVSIEPQTSKVLPLPCKIPLYNDEFVLTVSMFSEHELSFGQCVIKSKVKEELQLRKVKPVTGKSNLGFDMGDSYSLFWTREGKFNSVQSGKTELIQSPMLPDFWRAPTDNDKGNDYRIHWLPWKIASLYARRIEEIMQDESLVVKYDLGNGIAANCQMEFVFYENNKFDVTLSLEVESPEEQHIPAFGLSFEMPVEFDNVCWYGNGPEETYSDRKAGGKLGLYRNKVAENLVEYLNPQECGNKTDLRFIEVTNQAGRGLRMSSEELFECSVLPYNSHQLEHAHHLNHLSKPMTTFVHLAKKKCGVGGDDSWGAPVHQEYQVKLEKNMKFTIRFEVL